MQCQQEAEKGLALLKQAILGYVRLHPEGVTNAQVAHDLGLASDFQGNQKNYLSWSILGLMVNEGVIAYKPQGRSRVYYVL